MHDTALNDYVDRPVEHTVYDVSHVRITAQVVRIGQGVDTRQFGLGARQTLQELHFFLRRAVKVKTTSTIDRDKGQVRAVHLDKAPVQSGDVWSGDQTTHSLGVDGRIWAISEDRRHRGRHCDKEENPSCVAQD